MREHEGLVTCLCSVRACVRVCVVFNHADGLRSLFEGRIIVSFLMLVNALSVSHVGVVHKSYSIPMLQTRMHMLEADVADTSRIMQICDGDCVLEAQDAIDIYQMRAGDTILQPRCCFKPMNTAHLPDNSWN